MDGEKISAIMQSHGVISVSYKGVPVWIEGLRGEIAEVTVIGSDRRIDVPISELREEDGQCDICDLSDEDLNG